MNIFLTQEMPEKGKKLLEIAGHHLTIWQKEYYPKTEDLIKVCQQQDVLIVIGPVKIEAKFLRACPHLEMIALHSAGYDHVDIDAAKKMGIFVSNTGAVGSRETANTAFFLMIAAAKKAFYQHRRIFEGIWEGWNATGDLGIHLYGKTLGVFGLGQIGYEMARLSKAAYGMTVLYHNRHRNERAENELKAEWVSFEDLLKQSDIISVHANLNKATYEKFNKKAFDQMKTSAIFVNTARGSIHDELALTRALKRGKIWGAGLDVSRPEPMKMDNPLLSFPNVAVTPHIGNATEDARAAMSQRVAENILAFAEGQKIPNEVI